MLRGHRALVVVQKWEFPYNMIPKAHHKQYYTQAEDARKRFAKYDITGNEYMLFVALKGIRKSHGSRDSLHFFFSRLKNFLGCGGLNSSNPASEYVKGVEKMHPGLLGHVPDYIDFDDNTHPWKKPFSIKGSMKT